MNAASRTLRRHTRDAECPICGGYDTLPQGRGVRCAGFSTDDFAFCSREEFAGNAPFDASTSPGTFRHRLQGSCECGRGHGRRVVLPSRAGPEPAGETLSVLIRHEIYEYALSLLPLRREALDDLTTRGLTEAQVYLCDYRSLPTRGIESRSLLAALKLRFSDATLKLCPGFEKDDKVSFWTATPGHDGYLVPYKNESAIIVGLQFRRFEPRKYITAKGTKLAGVYHIAGTPQPGAVLAITEGATKANVASALGGIAVFAVAGQSLTATHIEAIKRLRPGRVIVALDQEQNENTDRARDAWLRALRGAALNVYNAVWEGDDLGGPKGLDDLFKAGGRPRLRQVWFAPAGIGGRHVPRETAAAGPVELGMTLAQARQVTSDAIATFVQKVSARGGRALLVSSSPGAGKTRQVAAALIPGRRAGRLLVGTTALARELAAQHGYVPIAGRNPENCQRYDVVRALGESGHDVERLGCGTTEEPRCSFRDSCGYWRQFEQPGLRVGSSEQLYNPNFLLGGSIAVLDDAELPRAMIEQISLDLGVLERAVGQLLGQRREPARRLLNLLGHAVLDAPRSAKGVPQAPLQGAAAWDHLVRTARRQGVDLGAAIHALPKNGTLPEPGDGARILSLEQVEAVAPPNILLLFEALQDELPSFESGVDFNSRIRLNATGIEVWRLREHVRDDYGSPLVAGMDLIVLDATPVMRLVDHVTKHHQRCEDVSATVRLPENVRVVQTTASTFGHSVLANQHKVQDMLAEVAAARRRFPVSSAEREAAICFKAMKKSVTDLGFLPDQVLTFGAVRGTNALEHVERLHVVGRSMPPADDLIFLAQVLHAKEPAVSRELIFRPVGYGGQRYEVDVLDFADPRLAALLKAEREDEIVQAIHRARIFNLDASQMELDGDKDKRRQIVIALHTSQPIAGLRVDELDIAARQERNDKLHDDAVHRVSKAVLQLQEQLETVTDQKVAKLAGASRRTVAKILRGNDHTLSNSSYKGVITTPQSCSDPPPEDAEDALADEGEPQPNLCRGGCGKSMPPGQMCFDCASREVDKWVRSKKGRKRSA